MISYEEFSRMNMRVAEVLSAEKVKGADKLIRLEVDIGDGKRQIVAGIAGRYEPDTLVGKKIIVLENLEPKKLRGIQSNGMLLAAGAEEELVLLTVDGDIMNGAKVS
ncbi:MAG: methionine--tRNA ligase subunit beta [Candidatus Aenigmarchaeota archaeon]|nr:methionine--tRNA ligase subunit beta [Candidatus Aenigmarchaeota archaeon]